jgi:hypothetical protein
MEKSLVTGGSTQLSAHKMMSARSFYNPDKSSNHHITTLTNMKAEFSESGQRRRRKLSSCKKDTPSPLPV